MEIFQVSNIRDINPLIPATVSEPETIALRSNYGYKANRTNIFTNTKSMLIKNLSILRIESYYL